MQCIKTKFEEKLRDVDKKDLVTKHFAFIMQNIGQNKKVLTHQQHK